MGHAINRLRENMYDGFCKVCREEVKAHVGKLWGDPPKPYHTECMEEFDAQGITMARPKSRPNPFVPPAPVAAAEPEPDKGTLAKTADEIVAGVAEHFLKHVPDMVKEQVLTLAPRVLEIKRPKQKTVKVQVHHRMLPTLLMAVEAGASPMLVGPAGSGKTTLAMDIATSLGRNFYSSPRVTHESRLLGYFHPHSGELWKPQFRLAYEFGGVFLLGEIDASDADALVSINTALANKYCDFPDGIVHQHEDFICLADANTWGRGADQEYIGRNQLDAASIDRFQQFFIDYDENLEVQLAGNLDWVKRVQAIRKAVATEKVRLVVSPRASIMGARMLEVGMEQPVVEDACIWKGLDAPQRARILARVAQEA